ncbi:hypothetical protein PENTCL1PPCAC_6031, partial [Pristionchus entomophagus]
CIIVHDSSAFGQTRLAGIHGIEVDSRLQDIADVTADLLSAVLDVDVISTRHEGTPWLAIVSISDILDRFLYIICALSPIVHVIEEDIIEALVIIFHDLLVVAHVGAHREVSCIFHRVHQIHSVHILEGSSSHAGR